MKRSLFVSTFVLCTFIQTGTAQIRVEQILDLAGTNRGVCCFLGGEEELAGLPVDLAKASGFLVHVIDPNPAVISQLRSAADAAGLPIQRLLAETGSLARLPHAANTLDLVVSLSDEPGSAIGKEEILRALRPEGVAIFFDDGQPDTFAKPVPPGLDEWSHWEKAPDNNPVSQDEWIKAPYMTQFLAKPWYIGMPAITTAAGGRTFLAMGHIAHHQREWDQLNWLIGRNGYNGTVLWKERLPDDYLVHRSAFVATKEVFYRIDGDSALMLDAKTGQKKGKIHIPDFPGDWKWIAMEDGILFALAGEPGDGVELVKGDRALGGWSWSDLSKGYYGKRIPHGFGDVVAAYDTAKEKVIWIHRESSLIDSRGLAIRDGKFFLYCPDKHFRCLDLASGEVVWTNDDSITLGLIEEAGKGLISTPGWRTQTLVVATPEALVIQGQTRMNIVGVSTRDGSMLWHKKKITNNPNAIYVDGKIVMAVGERASHIVIDPVTGTVEKDLKFFKRACTRLTASTDSFFVRGEGMTRFDRDSGQVLIDGSARPGCNDGVIPANGLIYLGPWACDCNLSLIGSLARCSAGGFDFDDRVTVESRLERGSAPPPAAGSFEITDSDWPTYRHDNGRSASTPVAAKRGRRILWQFEPERDFSPTETVATGGLVFLGGEDGKIRALDSKSGAMRWSFQSGGPVKYPPTISKGRAYFGSGDGFAYCLDAASGAMLWRFRAAPVDRKIMVYDSLCSTWPVSSGVLIHRGAAYFGAGIIDHDGTHLYSLDALSGETIWENHSSGHLNPELRKGVSVQGNLTIQDDSLVLAGGNVVSPARFGLEIGNCLETAREQGQPQSNGGKFVGSFGGKHLVAGGRILYSSPRNVSTKGSFSIWPGERRDGRSLTLNYGGIPPAWNDTIFAAANFKYGQIAVIDAKRVLEKAVQGLDDSARRGSRFTRNIVDAITSRGEERWQSKLGDSAKFEAISIVLANNAVITVARYQNINRAVPQFFLTGMNPQNGGELFQIEIPGEPLPGGLSVDRDGKMLVSLLNGSVVCFGE